MTTTTDTWAALATALHDRQPLWVTYHGHQRLICPHALGWHHGRALLLAYQTGGHTSTSQLDPDPQHRWRCLRVDHIETISPADHHDNWATATNYDPTQPFPNNATTLSTAIRHPA